MHSWFHTLKASSCGAALCICSAKWHLTVGSATLLQQLGDMLVSMYFFFCCLMCCVLFVLQCQGPWPQGSCEGCVPAGC